jgi:tetratricopeptide (TPR) repeat protein
MIIDREHEIEELIANDKIEQAQNLAVRWTQEEDDNPQAWNELAYVAQFLGNWTTAQEAIVRATQLAPDDLGYLFEKGVIEYKLQEFNTALVSFKDCVQKSNEFDSDYYLDAAKIAMGQSLFACGQYQSAAMAIQGLAPEAATWVEGRMTAGELGQNIEHRAKLARSIRF